MQKLKIRKTKEADMKRVTRLIIDSSNALRKAHGLDIARIRVTRPNSFFDHFRRTDPDGCFSAFEGDRLVGYGSAIIREHEWYLAFLFVTPGRWNRGIGRKLLDKTIAYGKGNGSTRFSLCTYSYNPDAVALYSLYGMTPHVPILHLEWTRDKNRGLKIETDSQPLDETEIKDYEELEPINKLDRKNRGIARPEDHKFCIDSDDHHMIAYSKNSKIVGYASLYRQGLIAPITATSPEYLRKIINQSISRQLSAGADKIRLFCAGSSRKTLMYLLSIGLHIGDIDLLLTEKPFGNLKLYLPAHLAMF